MSARVKVEGLRELERALQRLPKATGKNVLRRTLKEVAEPMIVDAAAKAPVGDDGSLRDNIVVSTQLSKRQRKLHRKMFASDRASVEMFAGAAALPHAHLVEFGTGPRFHESGKYVGEMPAQPFLRPRLGRAQGPDAGEDRSDPRSRDREVGRAPGEEARSRGGESLMQEDLRALLLANAGLPGWPPPWPGAGGCRVRPCRPWC